jgi:mRNA interferase MazF
MKGGMMYKKRDIVLIPFSYTDLTGSKQRPALIISNENLSSKEDRICCLITSNIHTNDLPISKDNFAKGKLPFKSSVMPHRIFTINKSIVRKRLCTIKSEFHNKVIEEINKFLI